MNTKSVCGIWHTPRRLVAVVDCEGGTAEAESIVQTTEARWGLVAWLSVSGVGALVVTEALSGDELLAIAREAGLDVWLAPVSLVEAVRAAAAVTHRPPRHTAALLARWPAQPALRQHMHRIAAGPERRQLHLW